jgi:hypothetical protein
LTRTARHSLFALLVLALAALAGHMVNCTGVSHHDFRPASQDARVLENNVAELGAEGGGSNGRNGVQLERFPHVALAAWPLQVAFIANAGKPSASATLNTRNTALAHRRVTVLLV